jgi:hypothetical protein
MNDSGQAACSIGPTATDFFAIIEIVYAKC